MRTHPTCAPVVASSTIGSVNADGLPLRGPTIDGMSKAALVTSTEGLAPDLASRKIAANIVQPTRSTWWAIPPAVLRVSSLLA